MLRKQSALLKILLFCVCFLVYSNGFAQGILNKLGIQETSVFAGFGMTKFYGDIGGYATEKFAISDINSSYNIGVKCLSSNKFSYSLLFDFNNNFQSNDSETHLSYRNMAFKSTLWDISGSVQYTFFGGNYLESNKPNSIYVLSGIGFARSNAHIFYQGALNYEDKIKLNESALTLFAGLGYQYRFSKKISAGIEYRAIQYLSDYIDGFHPYNSKRDDMSMDLRVNISYYFNINSSDGK